METKTAKIVSVQENQRQYDYQGTQYFEHKIKFEGSDQLWSYSSKSPICEKFKTGESATFDIEIKENGQYKNYKIKPAQAQGGNGYSGGKKADPKDQGMITFLSLYSSTCNFYAHRGQATIDQVLTDTERAFKKAMEHSTIAK